MAATLEVDKETGAEVRVETGTGTVQGVSHGERNVQVVIKSDNPKMRMPVTGWADGNNDALVLGLEEAQRTGARIAYRIVVHRKANIAPSIPLADVGNMDKVRDFVSFTVQEGDGPPRGDSHTAHAETMDQRLNGGAEAEPERQAPQATTPEPTYHDEPAAVEQVAPQVGDGRPSNRPVKVQEERPWEPFNTDGSLNVGSYAFSAAQKAVSHAGRLFRRYLQDTAAPFGEGEDVHAAPDLGRCKAVARHLLIAAQDAQAACREDGAYDMMDASYTRALSAVVDASYIFPPPFGAGGDLDAIKAWRASLTEYAAGMMRAAADLTREGLN